MLLLVVVVIALGWLLFAVGWGRNKLSSATYRYSSPLYSQQGSGLFAAPRTEHMARLRRQQVLVSLIGIAILTLLMTRLWTFMWALHIAADIAAIAFAFACYARSQGRRSLVSQVGDPQVDSSEAASAWSYEPLYADDAGVGPLRFHDDVSIGHLGEFENEREPEPVGAHF